MPKAISSVLSLLFNNIRILYVSGPPISASFDPVRASKGPGICHLIYVYYAYTILKGGPLDGRWWNGLILAAIGFAGWKTAHYASTAGLQSRWNRIQNPVFGGCVHWELGFVASNARKREQLIGYGRDDQRLEIDFPVERVRSLVTRARLLPAEPDADDDHAARHFLWWVIGRAIRCSSKRITSGTR